MNHRISIIISLLLSATLGFSTIQKPQHRQNLEIISDFDYKGELRGNMRVETITGIPRAIYSPNYPVTSSDPESMAREYLSANKSLLQHQAQQLEIKYLRTVKTPGGSRVQFVQLHNDHEIYKASIKVSINNEHQVVFVMNGYQNIGSVSNQIKLTESAALDLAKQHLKITGEVNLEKIDLIVYPRRLRGALWTYRTIIVPGGESYGDWEILVDAETGEIVRAEDKACYQAPFRENGTGWVFDPDPISSARTYYGQPQFSNSNDQDTDSLTAQLQEVRLEDIAFRNGLYQLEGPYAAIMDFESPYTGLYAQDSSTFLFTRSQDAFEAVNTYFHLHNSMKYLNETLGFDVMPFQYEGGVRFDPRGLNGDVNAHYLSSLGAVAFGAPSSGVDAAEDHAIILHELGHGIHDWITGGGLSQVEGLSEGLGDYWAQSYTRSLGLFNPSDPQYDYFGLWGLQPFGQPFLRVTNFPNHYPQGLGGEVHYDGQLWASTLMTVWDAIGRTATDTDCWEAISMTDANTNQVDAAFAFLQADQDIFAGANIGGILPAFVARGYLPGPVVARFDADITGGPGPLTVHFEDQSYVAHPPLISWAWDFNNDGLIDSEEQNPEHTYSEPGLYTVTLTASDGTATNTHTQQNFISVNTGVVVFDGKVQDWNVWDYSGTFIYDHLSEMGIPASYSNQLWSSLVGYEAVFISLGNLGENLNDGTFLSPDDLMSIVGYLNNGGNLYLEGGSLMGGAEFFGTPDYEEFWNLFGIESAFINWDQHPVSALQGQTRSIAAGMQFTASTQVNNWYLDDVVANGNGTVAFSETGLGNVAIQGQGIHGQRTFYSAYSMANLVDGDQINTRRQLLISMLEFFRLPILLPAFSASINSGHAPLTVDFADVSAANPPVQTWAWDFNGDDVIDSNIEQPSWIFETAGDYDVTLTVGNGDTTRTILLTDVIRVFDGETALNFLDNDNYVYVASTSSLNVSSGLTVEAWINPSAWGDGNDGDGRIVDKSYYRLFLNKAGSSTYPDSTLCVLIKHEDGTLSKASAMAHDIRLNEWQYVAVSYDGATSDIHVYINGVDRTVINRAPSGNIKENGDKDLMIGNSPTFSGSFQGRLDELRIWGQAVPEADINARMDTYLNGDESGLLAYWQMNDAHGDIISDATSNENHGFITLSTWEWGTDFVVPVALDGETLSPHSQLLVQAYPNPFNTSTTIQYSIPEPSQVEMIIFNLQGKVIQKLNLDQQEAGWHQVRWKADLSDGTQAATGIYFCKIQTRSEIRTTKLLLLK